MVDDDTRRPWEPARLNPELAAALVAALGELDDVAKTRTAAAGQYSYRYATLGDVLGEARPVLARHGLALSQHVDVHAVDRGVSVAVHTRVVHVSGHVLEVPPLAITAAATAQAIGSAATYGRRYQAMAVLGVAGDDDDGAEATRTAPATPPAPSPRTDAERAIRRMLDAVPADVARRVRDAFREHFHSTLAALPADRHDDALAWVTDALDVALADAADRASADAAHLAAEEPDPVTPGVHTQP